ncbi:unnamed protein product [Euphydryas editha]|uniref:Uncharacterized protein n=1 Tax=Euphydryas editha TaxID=104508 RepID=A0AAU9UJK5_EUPED|nr:unnamed protein product [Euphydryas editha]
MDRNSIEVIEKKIMLNVYTVPSPISVENSTFEIIDEYIHLEKKIQLCRPDIESEANRRIQLGLADFGKLMMITTDERRLPT